MKDWLYFYIKQTLQIGAPFYKYKGYGIYTQHSVFHVENKKCAQTTKFQPEAPLLCLMSKLIS
ncbi:hypothetical protein AS4_28520 [Acinetobacter guillouiae]|nr:hypothetical protein AS4_28520 [Acinetobacter guillouiae]